MENIDLSDLENGRLEQAITDFMSRMQVYNAGIKEIKTKLEILDDEFKAKYDYDPIHHIESRLKTPRSILNKLRSRGLAVTYENIKNEITDIAGVRVICNYIDDTFKIAEMLGRQDDLKQLRRADYINAPKESGYRSLHLVVEVPIFLAESTMPVPVEIQIRTIAMDFWASLEHRLEYKGGNDVDEALRYRLRICAEAISEVDAEMQAIQKEILGGK